jgi:2'-5' RNA ligase
MKRIFIAIKIYPDPSFKGFIKKLQAILEKEKIRWVNPHNLHLTLRFLGETNTELIPQISAELSNVALETKTFTINLTGVGVFRSVSYPRVLWVGIEKNEDLQELKNMVDYSLKNVGFAVEDKSYIPHLTLGRMKRINNRNMLRNLLKEYGEEKLQVLHAESMIFYESKLSEDGPEYIPIKEYFFL